LFLALVTLIPSAGVFAAMFSCGGGIISTGDRR
jgi:hypothetical protein